LSATGVDHDVNKEVKKASARRTRRDFLVAGLAAAGGYKFYKWIEDAPGDQLLAKPLRKMLDVNAAVSRAVFKDRGLAPTFPLSQARELRVNGNYGVKQRVVPESYRLQVVGVDGAKKFPQYVDDVTTWEYKFEDSDEAFSGHDTKVAPKADAGSGTAATGSSGPASPAAPAADAAPPGVDPSLPPEFQKAFAALAAASGGKPPRGQEEAGESDSTLDPGTPGLLLKLEDVTRFPHQEMVTQFKCIEGWSEIVHWGGVRLRDFIEAYPPAKNAQGKLPEYVYMETPNGDYYCGFHLNECMHPQSLLVTEMSGKPLTQFHGAPLRLSMPIKYGYKQIKSIGLIAYTDEKPDDYWTKLGYDWYAGL
jgi:hypothetical protein